MPEKSVQNMGNNQSDPTMEGIASQGTRCESSLPQKKPPRFSAGGFFMLVFMIGGQNPWSYKLRKDHFINSVYYPVGALNVRDNDV